MLTVQLVEEYLAKHIVAARLNIKHQNMIKQIFISLIAKDDAESFARISRLIAYCNEQLIDSNRPEPAIARIANKALSMLLSDVK